MISGRQTLALIDQGLQRQRRRLEALEGRLEETGNRLLELRRQESALYRQLARLRAHELADGRFEQKLDRAERRALELLQARRQAMQALNRRTEASREEQARLEARRQAQADKVTAAAERLQQRLDQVHGELVLRSDYQARQQTAQEAVDTLAAAREKIRQSREEYQKKGQPYRDDPLFMYLWQAGYGTSSYRAHALRRFFDRLLARHIRYQALRQNYHMLATIPQRLEEHGKRLQARAEEAMAKLSAMEEAAEQAGGIPALEAALAAEEQVLQALDADIARAEERYASLLAELNQFAAGEDSHLKEAIEGLVENFRAEPIPELRREAALTLGNEDDSLVSRLAELRQDKQALEQELEENRHVHAIQNERLHDLEALRRRFKQENFDASNSRFSNDVDLADRLDDFLQGAMDAHRLWNHILRNQRFIRFRQFPAGGGVAYPGNRRLPEALGLPADLRLPRGVRLPPGALEEFLGGVIGGVLRGGIRLPRGGGPGGDLFGGGGRGGGGFHTGGGF